MNILFFLTVAVTVAMLLLGVRRAMPPLLLPAAGVLAAWMGVTGVLAGAQLLSDFQRRPPPMMLILLSVLVLPALVAFSRIGTAGAGLPLPWLIGFHAFRIPVELFLHTGVGEGLVPHQMSWDGRNWDILTGISALPVAWLAMRGALPVWAAKVWNLAGLALLGNVVTVAVLSMPTPFRRFHNEPANVFVTQFPYVWLPAVLVASAWLGHLLLLRRLHGGLNK